MLKVDQTGTVWPLPSDPRNPSSTPDPFSLGFLLCRTSLFIYPDLSIFDNCTVPNLLRPAAAASSQRDKMQKVQKKMKTKPLILHTDFSLKSYFNVDATFHVWAN